ncbi:hypothetical protein N9023_03615 [Opitutaceae bacterium]|nr:hypothetical protein [Opitutaceae bacterium]MDB4474069.1 hypothetical protein [Opitutaceae bacterium]
MQRSHRQRHRRFWMILGPAIILALILSYTTRPYWPVNEPKVSHPAGGDQ